MEDRDVVANDVIDAVASQIKYYMEVKRREDGFNLSGTNEPKSTYPQVKISPMLSTGRLHDRSLKHYFADNMIKTQIAQLQAVAPGSSRENDIKQRLRKKITASLDSFHVVHKSYDMNEEMYTAQREALKYLHKNAKHRLRKNVYNEELFARQNSRLSAGEAVRLMKKSSQILAGTETVAQGRDAMNQSDALESRPPSLPSARRCNNLPKLSDENSGPRSSRQATSKQKNQTRSRKAPKYRWDLNGRRILCTENNATEASSSFSMSSSSIDMQPHRSFHSENPRMMKSLPENSQSSHKLSSATLRRNSDDVTRRRYHTARKPFTPDNGHWMRPGAEMESSKNDKVKHRHITKHRADNSDSQHQLRKYRVEIRTGDLLGSGTTADIYLSLHGDKCETDEIYLTNPLSKERKWKPFRRSQVDIFEVEAENIGDLKKIGIGHDMHEKSYDWFVDYINVMCGGKSWTFHCGTWLSETSARKKTFRYFTVNDTSSETSGSDSNEKLEPALRRNSGQRVQSGVLQEKPKTKKSGKSDSSNTRRSSKDVSSIRQKLFLQLLQATYKAPDRTILKKPQSQRHRSTDEKPEKAERGQRSKHRSNVSKRNVLKGKENNIATSDDQNQAKTSVIPQQSKNSRKHKPRKISKSRQHTDQKKSSLERSSSDSDDFFPRKPDEKSTFKTAVSGFGSSTGSSDYDTDEETPSLSKRRTAVANSPVKKGSSATRAFPQLVTTAMTTVKKLVAEEIKVNKRGVPSSGSKYDDDKSSSCESQSSSSEQSSLTSSCSSSSEDDREISKIPETLPNKQSPIADPVPVPAPVLVETAVKLASPAYATASGETVKEALKEESKVNEVNVLVYPSSNARSSSSGSDTEPASEEGKNMTGTSNAENGSDLKHKEKTATFMEGFHAGLDATRRLSRTFPTLINGTSAANERGEDGAVLSEREQATRSDIHSLIKEDDAQKVMELVNLRPDLKEQRNEKGWTPLHVAATLGRLNILQWLTANHTNLNTETSTGYTALHMAVMHGHVQCCMVLHAMGADLDAKNMDGQMCLHIACMSGHLETTKWLVANRANLKAQDAFQRTPLDLAKQYKHRDIVRFLRACRRDLRKKNSSISLLQASKSSLESSDLSSSSSSSDEEERASEKKEHHTWHDNPEGASPDDSVAELVSRNELEEKKMMYDKQHKRMARRRSSFLDAIRDEAISLDASSDIEQTKDPE